MTGARYRMLETIREYGQDRLVESGDESAVQRRHRDHFAALVEQTCAEWCGPDQQRLLNRVRRGHNNIRGALEFTLSEPGGAKSGLQMAGALWFFWLATGLTSEGRRWLERLLELDVTAGQARARALWVCAYLCVLQEDVPSAKSMIKECRRQADQVGDADTAAWAVQLVGMAAMSVGELAEARAHLEAGLEQHRVCGNDVGFLDTCFYLVAVTALLGELHRATQLWEEALALCDSHRERWLKSYMLWDLGLVAWQLGDNGRAAASGRDGLRLAREFNEQWAIASCMEILAWTTHAELKHRRAAQLLGCADSIWRRIGAPLFGVRQLLRYHEQCHEGVRTALGSRFDAEFRSGAEMGLDRAIALALGEPDPQLGHASSSDQAAPTLTPRELEVAQLIAQGLSNKAIAAKLVIARRTAEAHVERILDKLGFSSRTQVAAWVAEVLAELRRRMEAVVDGGVAPERIVIDPGLGFAKNAEPDLALLAHLHQLRGLGRPLLVGASRKRVLGRVLTDEKGTPPPTQERDAATAAVSAIAAHAGAWAVRVHSVRATADAVRVARAMESAAAEDEPCRVAIREPAETVMPGGQLQ